MIRRSRETSLTGTGGHLRPVSKPSAPITIGAFDTMGAGAANGSLSNVDIEPEIAGDDTSWRQQADGYYG
jgi:hypothetical protein